MRWAYVIAGLFVVGTCSLTLYFTRGKEPPTLIMHEMSLRGRVAHMKVPAYPENSTACGVAVAQFEIGTAGQIYSHRILTAPDGATRVALENALAEWRFSPLTGVRDSDMASHFVGKLTFYFVNVSGDVNEAKVYSAQDAPFVGDCVLRDIAKARQS